MARARPPANARRARPQARKGPAGAQGIPSSARRRRPAPTPRRARAARPASTPRRARAERPAPPTVAVRAPRRLVALLVVVTIAFGGMVIRLVTLQIGENPRFARLAADQRQRSYTFPAHRGGIFDRNGESLAISIELQTVFTDHVHIEDAARVAAKLAPVLDMSRREIEEKLRPEWPGDQFEYIARQVSPKTADEVEKLDLPGIYMRPEPKRIYPSDGLAAHVLGFVGAEGNALEGIELQYDTILSGEPGRMTLEQDPSGRPLPQAEFAFEPARPGRSLYLTIDRELQHITESALREAVYRHGAIGGSAIIMRPRTGHILALANFPAFDPNHFNDATFAQRRNRAVIDVYEPGSAFKIVTAAGVLEEKVFKPNSTLVVPAQMQVADRVIHDSHVHPTAAMSVTDIIQQSSNVGTVKLGIALGADRLDEWILRFGFGRKTGLDFPGEARGIVLDRDEWWGSTIGNVPLGQGIAVTPLQLLTAYTTIANRGVWVEPKLIHSIARSDGRLEPTVPAGKRRVVSRKTAARMLEILEGVVTNGTGVMAQIPGYRVAGKTGTAQKPSPDGGYGDSHIGSFVGLAPARRPEIAVIVVLDEPHPIWGGLSAAPTFKVIAEQALRHLGIPPSRNAAVAAEMIEEDLATEPAPRD